MWPLASWRYVQVRASAGDTKAPWWGHHLGPGPEDWFLRIHGAHEGCHTTEAPTVPSRCFALDSGSYHVFLPLPSSVCSTLAWKTPWTEKPGVHGVARSRTRLSDFTFSFFLKPL